MRRPTAILALVLVFLGAVAPLAEAVTGCVTGCPDDDAGGRCGDATCCSCCVYAAPATVPSPGVSASIPRSTLVPLEAASRPHAAHSRGPLHVPKASLI
jgi:hypothetical protein